MNDQISELQAENQKLREYAVAMKAIALDLSINGDRLCEAIENDLGQSRKNFLVGRFRMAMRQATNAMQLLTLAQPHSREKARRARENHLREMFELQKPEGCQFARGSRALWRPRSSRSVEAQKKVRAIEVIVKTYQPAKNCYFVEYANPLEAKILGRRNRFTIAHANCLFPMTEGGEVLP